jgi:hypothetical protein
MKKSIIALFALTSSYVYAAEIMGTVVSVQSATKMENCYTCDRVGEEMSSNFAANIVSDLDNNIVVVETPNKNLHTFKIESKYALKVGQMVDVVVDEKLKENVNVAQSKETLAAK